MSNFTRVRPLPDAPSFVHFSWLDEDPPPTAVTRRPLTVRLTAMLKRLTRALSIGREA
jgi:hypothetical protein